MHQIINRITPYLFFLAFLTISPNELVAQSFEDGVIFLSETIASNNFSSLNCSDVEKIDSLFKIALIYYNNDISESLLALTFATLPFNKMSVQLPLINVRIPLRLPAVNDELFFQKKNNLPGLVLFNSAKISGNDKDKVAHFFGNAFLAYNVSFINLSKILGFVVEMFETAFQVSKGVDNRDLDINYLGEFFGNSLQKNPRLNPSHFFKLYSLFYFSYN